MDGPFIKLFSSPWHKYFYDVGRDEIVMVSDELFNRLYLVENGDTSWQEIISNPDEELHYLIDEGYLSSKRPSIIRHPLAELAPYYLSRKIDMVTLQVTQECNFRCRYCVYSGEVNKKQRSHTQEAMTWDTAKRAVDFYISHSLDSENRRIGFYGGEPLLHLELIKKVVEYAKQRAGGKCIDFHITTNGSLLKEEVVSFLERNNFQLLVSMDGLKKSHDKNRVFKNGKGTFDSVIENLLQIKEKHPKLFDLIQINTVLDPMNDFDSMIGLNNKLACLPKDNFRYNYLENDGEVVRPTTESLAKSEYHGFLAYLALCNQYPKERLSPLSLQFYREAETNFRKFQSAQTMPDICSHGGPCIAGKTRLFISSDGTFYPCERVNEKPHMSIGNLNEGFDYKQVSVLMNVGNLTSEQCKRCWAIRHCTVCSKLCDDGKELSAKVKLRHCNDTRRSVETIIRSVILQDEIGRYPLGRKSYD